VAVILVHRKIALINSGVTTKIQKLKKKLRYFLNFWDTIKITA